MATGEQIQLKPAAKKSRQNRGKSKKGSNKAGRKDGEGVQGRVN